jgi:GDPmannose 4,6-dehydratase
MDSIVMGTLNMLEAIRFLGRDVRYYNAGSGECFGDTGPTPATEDTPFKPKSPYAVAKACAHNLVATYREAYSLFACSGILYNHESPLRPERFVTQKIIRHAARVAAGSREKLPLGNVDIVRDWGWAPEYVEAMWLMMQQAQASDYIIATGKSFTLTDFLAAAFAEFGLDWSQHVQSDRSLLRAADHRMARANPGRAARDFGWRATVAMPEVIRRMAIAVRT